MKAHIDIGIKGEFKLQKLKKGVVIEELSLQNNLILNRFFQTLNSVSPPDSISPTFFILYGSGSITPTVGDTSLAAILYDTPKAQTSITYGIDHTTNPVYSLFTEVRVFDTIEGTVVGNVAEFGLKQNYSGTTGLHIRSLLKDVNGSPTTVTVLADETLRLTHTLTFKEKKAPYTFNATIGGNAYVLTLARSFSSYSGSYNNYNFWRFGTQRQVSSTNCYPVIGSARIGGSFNFTTNPDYPTFSGSTNVAISVTKANVGILGGDTLTGYWDITIPASIATVSDNLLALLLFSGSTNGASYENFYLMFTPYLKKNPQNKLTFRMGIRYTRE